MKPGTLVMTKNRWGMDSRLIGVVIERTETGEDTWRVLWATKSSYKLQEHLGSNLLDIDRDVPTVPRTDNT